MKEKEIIVGVMVYHFAFGWAQVSHPPTGGKVNLELEADEISFYSMNPPGYRNLKRQPSGSFNIRVPIEEVFKSSPVKLSKKLALKKVALNPKTYRK